jgi:flagellar biogenesis protein FliO
MSDFIYYGKILIVFAFVIGLINLASYFFKKYSDKFIGIKPVKNNYLQLVENLIIDVKRRVVVVEHQDKQYILLLGNNDVLMDVIDKKK